MSRDSSGTYTLPLPDVVAGDTIEATWANTSFADFETELTDSLSRSGKGGMTAALKIAAGTVSAPGIAFSSETNSGFYRAAAGDIRFAVGGVEVWRTTSSGLRVASENFVVGTAGKGVDFTAQTATAATGATTTAEILNHYEEGTWTPAIYDGSFADEGQTYSTRTGYYTRIGRIVFLNGRITMSGLSTLAGSIVISGLPFNTSKVGTGLSVGLGSSLGLSAAYSVSGYIDNYLSTSYIYLTKWSATSGVSNLTAAELTASGSLQFSMAYQI